MKHGHKTLLCVLGGLTLCGGAGPAFGLSSDVPYQAIVERNLFGLKPPPPPGPDPASTKAAPPKITLNGITTILGNKRALLKTSPTGKTGEQAKEQSYMLAEGQRDGDLEVLKIDEIAGSVMVKYDGADITLTFEKDGPKGNSSPPPPGGAPGGGMAPPGVGPASAGMNSGGGLGPMPTRALRMPTSGGASSANATEGGVSSPGYGVAGSAATASQGQSGNASPPLTAEESTAIIEAQRQHYKDIGSPIANLFPPTPLTPARDAADESGANDTSIQPTPTSRSGLRFPRR